MLQELLPLLPQELSSRAQAALVAGLIIAAALWLVGARFSRALITLTTVTLGAVAGMVLPRWYGWGVNTMATAVGGAIVLGLSGFILHRLWVGIALGALMGAWGAVITWALYRQGTPIPWPETTEGMLFPDVVRHIWFGMPDLVRQMIPYTAGAVALTGLAMGVLWKRIGPALLYSLLGVTLMIVLGLIATASHPEWLAKIPPDPRVNGAIVLGVIVLGAVIQQLLLPLPNAPVATSQELMEESLPHAEPKLK